MNTKKTAGLALLAFFSVVTAFAQKKDTIYSRNTKDFEILQKSNVFLYRDKKYEIKPIFTRSIKGENTLPHEAHREYYSINRIACDRDTIRLCVIAVDVFGCVRQTSSDLEKTARSILKHQKIFNLEKG